MAAMMLADQGADVIKIEPPMIGDRARYLGSMRAGMGAMFAVLNRNKRSLVLDLKIEAEKDVFLKLVGTADVLIENYRPGVVRSLGIDHETLLDLNPALIYTSISGYGQSGPYANRRVYDPLVQATAGAAAAQGGESPENMATIMFDKVTALTAAQAITAALLERSKTGRGRYLPISMLESALYNIWPDVMWSRTLLGGGIAHQGELADYFPTFRAKDGFISIITTADESFEMFCIWRGSELHLDERFSTLRARLANAAELKSAINLLLADVTTVEACKELDSMGVPVARVNTLDEVHTDEQVVHAGALIETEHPQLGTMRYPRPPEALAPEVFPERHAPFLGDQTREILEALEVDDAVIRALEERDKANAETMRVVLEAMQE